MERPIKELLQIMVDNIELFEKKGCMGLCDLTNTLKYNQIISDAEESIIDKYVDTNAPKIPKSTYNWTPYELQPRLEWLNEQIAKL